MTQKEETTEAAHQPEEIICELRCSYLVIINYNNVPIIVVQ